MITAPAGVLRVLYGIRGQIVSHALYLSRFLKALCDVFTFAIHSWIDLVGEFSGSNFFFKPYIVRASAYPDRLSIPRKGSIPYPETMASCDHDVDVRLFIALALH